MKRKNFGQRDEEDGKTSFLTTEGNNVKHLNTFPSHKYILSCVSFSRRKRDRTVLKLSERKEYSNLHFSFLSFLSEKSVLFALEIS